MTISEFGGRIQTYYGQRYRAGQKTEIVRYLKRLPEYFLEPLYEDTIRTFSGRFNALPDIAVFDPIVQRLWGEKEQGRIASGTLMIDDGPPVGNAEGKEKVREIIRGLVRDKNVKRN